MFQDFEDRTDPSKTAPRLGALREALQARGLTGFLVPRADEHQGEYVPANAERLSWLTGFTGSAGLAIALREETALFVDGRYTLQARAQVDLSVVTPVHLADETPAAWLERHLTPQDKLGYDPWLHTPDEITRIEAAVARAGAMLKCVVPNPVDTIWIDRPAAPAGPVQPQPTELSGVSSVDKRRDIGQSLAKAGADAAVLTMPDSIAWLLNIRGRDVPHTPLVLAFAIVSATGAVELYLDPARITPELAACLGPDITLHAKPLFAEGLKALGAAKKRVLADPQTAAIAVFLTLDKFGATIIRGADPCVLPKACKNATELDGIRAAHKRDGAALTRFLAWLARTAPAGAVDEITAARKLEAFRTETGALVDLSFDTISGAGANGAIVHYRVTDRTNRPLKPGELYLVDSGAQYVDGTTDVTRTVAIGTPPDDARRHFTLVLKGHCALARARFPTGTNGAQLDTLARAALWDAGLDFDHGTGHGVGHFLSVHEGPQRISKAGHAQSFKPGMVVSNEPGYYKTGGYGIRLENLMVVTQAEPVPGGERPMHGFETLTLAPFDRALVIPELLMPGERDWLNAYHARVREVIGPLVDEDTRRWLAVATAPV